LFSLVYSLWSWPFREWISADVSWSAVAWERHPTGAVRSLSPCAVLSGGTGGAGEWWAAAGPAIACTWWRAKEKERG